MGSCARACDLAGWPKPDLPSTWPVSMCSTISLLADDPGCKPVPHDDTFSFVFDQLVLVRLKKADIELKTKNYPMFLASLFHVHDATLPGFEDLHRVEAAYVLNQFQTASIGLHLRVTSSATCGISTLRFRPRCSASRCRNARKPQRSASCA